VRVEERRKITQDLRRFGCWRKLGLGNGIQEVARSIRVSSTSYSIPIPLEILWLAVERRIVDQNSVRV